MKRTLSSQRYIISALIVAMMGFALLFVQATPAMAGKASPPGISYFPTSYQPALKALQKKHPNWQFIALNTNLNWNSVITAQTPPYPNNPSLTSASYEPAMKDTSFTGQIEPGWVRASKGAVAFQMDPRNWLDERNIFQFELLSYNSATHKLSGVQAILAGTFMTNTSNTPNIRYVNTAGGTSTISKSYPQAIMDAGKAHKISPYFIAAKIRQEVILAGGAGSNSVTGTVSGYTGIYNFYNIGAFGGSNPAIMGLGWARNGNNGFGTPWTDPVKSINGGANFLASGYINVGQDTIYLQKFNVNPSNPSQLHRHQYMTNIEGAMSEGQKLHDGYKSIGVLSTAKVFFIPVYTSMPASPAPRPNGFAPGTENLYSLNADGVNIRRGAGTNYASYGAYPRGTVVKSRKFNYATANGFNWAQVEISGGSIGYIANQFMTKVSSSPSTPNPSPTTPPVKRKLTYYQMDDKALKRTGTWTLIKHPGYSNSLARSSATKGSTYIARFKGWGVQWYGARVPGGGQADIYINGKYKMTIDTNSPTVQAGALLYTEGGYDPKKETELKIIVTNARGRNFATAVVVDRIAVFDGTLVGAAGTAPAPTDPKPVRKTTFYQMDDSLLKRTGTWTLIKHPGYSNSLARSSVSKGATYVAKFKGWGIKWYGAKVPGGGQADIYINGKYKTTVNTDSSTIKAGALIYSQEGFDPKKETELKIVVANAKDKKFATAVVVDRIGVVDGTLSGAENVKTATVMATAATLETTTATIETTAATVTATAETTPATTPVVRTYTSYDMSDPLLQKTGRWSIISHVGYSNGVAACSSTKGDVYVARFKGWGIQWYGARIPGGGQADIYIDGKYKTTIDTNSLTEQVGVLLYTDGGFDPNKETELKVVVTSAKDKNTAASIVVDRFVVIDGAMVGDAALKAVPESVPASSTTNSPLNSLSDSNAATITTN